MASMSQDRKLPAPEANPESQAFWDGAREKKLLLRKCTACGKVHYYPRAVCPFCLGDTEWQEASGKGTIYSFSVMRRAATPYAIGYVTLQEGVSMLTNFVDCDLDSLRIGQAVKLVFKPTEGEGAPLPMFTPT